MIGNSEPKPPINPVLTPGTVIAFNHVNQLPAFEDAIAPLIEPKYNPTLWAARPAVDEALRPRIKGRLFYGRLIDVTLKVMPEPYERLLDARQRGWNLGTRGNLNRTGPGAEEFIDRYQGFEFSAAALSTQQSAPIGTVDAELWYYPVPRLVHKAGTVHTSTHTAKSGDVRPYTSIARKDYVRVNSAYGETIRRVVTQPKYEPGKFVEVDDRSRRIGFEVAREAMRHPFRG